MLSTHRPSSFDAPSATAFCGAVGIIGDKDDAHHARVSTAETTTETTPSVSGDRRGVVHRNQPKPRRTRATEKEMKQKAKEREKTNPD